MEKRLMFQGFVFGVLVSVMFLSGLLFVLCGLVLGLMSL